MAERHASHEDPPRVQRLRAVTMEMRRSRPRSDLKRNVGTRTPKKRVLVVCEGEKTEPNYLSIIHVRSQNSTIDLIVVDEPATSPRELVDRACSELRESKRRVKRTKDPNENIDEVWCAFDVDDHKYIKEACNRAKDNGIRTAVSNPCLEVWLLMHFENPAGYLGRKEALRKLKVRIPDYEKNFTNIEHILGKYQHARKHAQYLKTKHVGDGTEFPMDNPASNIWELVESLKAQY
ncbi:RloB family protein [Rhodococcus qingshengii]|uniref:RloB family protein n=1 Tax=Rhodococcus qingshengii TaxID=334542 RepID=UPI0036DA9C45